MPSFILILPTVWPHTPTSQTGQTDRQQSDSANRFWATVCACISDSDAAHLTGRVYLTQRGMGQSLPSYREASQANI